MVKSKTKKQMYSIYTGLKSWHDKIIYVIFHPKSFQFGV